MLGQLSKRDLTLKEFRENRLGISLAVSVSIIVFIVVAWIGVYPCGYFDSDSGAYAGHGHHSLTTVVGNGFGWTSDTVPLQSNNYHGSGPFDVVADWWIAVLYIPILLAIVLLGLVIVHITPAMITRLRGD